MIEQYRPGYMRINGQGYHQDLKIIGREVVGNWWRPAGHRVDAGDLDDILKAKSEVLVIGTGYAGNMRVAKSLRLLLDEYGIQLVSEETAQAFKSFNRLYASGANVAGAFHLTC